MCVQRYIDSSDEMSGSDSYGGDSKSSSTTTNGGGDGRSFFFNILTIYYRFQTLFVLCITSDLILCDNERMRSVCSAYLMEMTSAYKRMQALV